MLLGQCPWNHIRLTLPLLSAVRYFIQQDFMLLPRAYVWTRPAFFQWWSNWEVSDICGCFQRWQGVIMVIAPCLLLSVLVLVAVVWLIAALLFVCLYVIWLWLKDKGPQAHFGLLSRSHNSVCYSVQLWRSISPEWMWRKFTWLFPFFTTSNSATFWSHTAYFKPLHSFSNYLKDTLQTACCIWFRWSEKCWIFEIFQITGRGRSSVEP